jgi:hypothetical protein
MFNASHCANNAPGATLRDCARANPDPGRQSVRLEGLSASVAGGAFFFRRARDYDGPRQRWPETTMAQDNDDRDDRPARDDRSRGPWSNDRPSQPSFGDRQARPGQSAWRQPTGYRKSSVKNSAGCCFQPDAAAGEASEIGSNPSDDLDRASPKPCRLTEKGPCGAPRAAGSSSLRWPEIVPKGVTLGLIPKF